MRGSVCKEVPATGYSCHQSPDSITLIPPKGRGVPLGRHLYTFFFRTTLVTRYSSKPSSCADTVLISSCSRKRRDWHRVAKRALSRVMDDPSASPTGKPVQWCMVCPLTSAAIAFWNARHELNTVSPT